MVLINNNITFSVSGIAILNRHTIKRSSNMKNGFCLILYLLLAISCQESEKDKLSRLVQEWDGKEIRFPARSVFTVQGDTVDFDCSRSAYKVVMYTDSVGCISCKLQLDKWKMFMQEVDSLQKQGDDVSFIFYFNSKDTKELQYIMRQDDFKYPVCLDKHDELNKINKFPSETTFQTFLLNRDNKVIATGNPIHNPKVKELYLKLMIGGTVSTKKQVLTMAELNLNSVNFGVFPKTNKQEQIVEINNIGKELLVIQDVSTSCGCTKVEFERKPIFAGHKGVLKIIYEANESGHFRKTVDVFCNIASSPLQIVVIGEVK